MFVTNNYYVTHLQNITTLQVLHAYQTKEDIVVPYPVLLDISFRGVHLIDKSKKNVSLSHIQFCDCHFL